MPYTKVTKDQFETKRGQVIHVPTGASFGWSYPKSASESLTINWGNAGNVLPNGDDYERDDIFRIAKELLVAVRKARVKSV